jgi:chitinase
LNVPGDVADGQYQLSVTGISNPEQVTRTALTVVDTVSPSAVSDLGATVDRKGKLTLRWTAASDNTNGSGVGFYRVYRNGALLQTVAGTATSYIDSSAVSGTTYTYELVTLDRAENQSAKSNSVTITIGSSGGGTGGGGKGGGKK